MITNCIHFFICWLHRWKIDCLQFTTFSFSSTFGGGGGGGGGFAAPSSSSSLSSTLSSPWAVDPMATLYNLRRRITVTRAQEEDDLNSSAPHEYFCQLIFINLFVAINVVNPEQPVEFLSRRGLHRHGEDEKELTEGDDSLALLIKKAENVLGDDLRF